MTEFDNLFDQLKRSLDDLKAHPDWDNEATRHDRLVYPVLVSPVALGWKPEDLFAQPLHTVSQSITESHIFRGATPRKRSPDIVIMPQELGTPVVVLEEKTRQPSIHVLNNHRLQLNEYQALFECEWGILTDGEHWVIKRGFATYHTFASLDELRLGMNDLIHIVGRRQMLHRLKTYGICNITIVAHPTLSHTPATFGGVESLPTPTSSLASMQHPLDTVLDAHGNAPVTVAEALVALREILEATFKAKFRLNIFTQHSDSLIRIKYSIGMDGSPDRNIAIRSDQGCVGYAFTHRRPVYAEMLPPNISAWRLTDSQMRAIREPQISSMLCVPILDNSQTVLSVLGADTPALITAPEKAIGLMQGMSLTLRVAIENDTH